MNQSAASPQSPLSNKVRAGRHVLRRNNLHHRYLQPLTLVVISVAQKHRSARPLSSTAATNSTSDNAPISILPLHTSHNADSVFRQRARRDTAKIQFYAPAYAFWMQRCHEYLLRCCSGQWRLVHPSTCRGKIVNPTQEIRQE